MNVELGLEAHFVLNGADSDELVEAHVSQVMAELVALAGPDGGFYDPAVSLDLGDRSVLIEVTASGDDFDAVVERADACIRSAIHAAGGATPDWNMEKRSQRADLIGA